MKVLVGIILLPIVLIVLGVLFCEANKYYWDRKIDGWCESELPKIYEIQYLNQDEYKKYLNSVGEVDLYGEGVKGLRAEGHEYYLDSSSSVLRKKFPMIIRFDSKIVRYSDSRIIAEHTSYSRFGGDFPTILIYPSSHNCISNEFQSKALRMTKEKNND